ncbi:MAG TPA: DsbA family oxidoreductase [Sandaracinaceae bacterium]
MRTLSIDVVSDVVCPWCLIGLHRLEQALEALPEVAAEVRFHPFLLDPGLPDEGVDLRARLREKYGLFPEAMFARVEAAAHESGIPLDFSKVTCIVPTTRAHTLLRHAFVKGTQRALKRALLEAYFLDGADVSDVDVLAAIAARHGFVEDEARALLLDEVELRATRSAAAKTAASGIDGVPFFIVDERFAFGGAQPVEILKKVIVRAVEASGP